MFKLWCEWGISFHRLWFCCTYFVIYKTRVPYRTRIISHACHIAR